MTFFIRTDGYICTRFPENEKWYAIKSSTTKGECACQTHFSYLSDKPEEEEVKN